MRPPARDKCADPRAARPLRRAPPCLVHATPTGRGRRAAPCASLRDTAALHLRATTARSQDPLPWFQRGNQRMFRPRTRWLALAAATLVVGALLPAPAALADTTP